MGTLVARCLLCLIGAALLVVAPAPPGAIAQGPGEPDCAGPAGDPKPGSAEWDKREDDNVYCATQRNRDTAGNPAYQAALAQVPPQRASNGMDPFREPSRWNESRFRYQELSYTDAAGKRFPALLFRPCDRSCHNTPAGLARFEPPYPGVVIMHGGAASQEMYLWAAEGLAEAGYMVLTFSIARTDDTHYADTKSALDFLTSTPARRSPSGAVNPRWHELDRRHIGLAGHSAGGVAVSRLGQEDPRVSAIVSWDRAQSGRMPAGLRLRTPALFMVSDFNCQQVPVCLPVRYSSPPAPLGPGNKDEDFQRVRRAGVDTMKIALRAMTHLTFTEFPQANGSRYGNVTAFYYTLAWFDRYLRGSHGALRRLTATTFDNSADVHNISGGTFDVQTQQNAPAHIAGQRVADRLSFHFRSACFLEHGEYRSENLRAGCPSAGLAGSGARCLPRRLAVSARRIGPARLGRSYRAFFRRYRAVRRGRGATRFCVRGGGRFLVGAHRGRIDFVASTARGHRTRRLGPGRRVPRAGITGAHSLRRGLLVGHRAGAGRVIYGVRRRRVYFLAVVTRRQTGHSRSLVRRLRRAGLLG